MTSPERSPITLPRDGPRPPAPPDPRLDPPPGLAARWLAALASRLLRVRGGLPLPSDLRSILVVRPDDRVGNALLTVPLARALKGLFPQARIDLLLAAKRAPVALGLPGIEVIPFEKQDAFRRPWRFLSLLLRLRRAGYDAVIDAAHWHSFSLTSALLSRWAGRRWVVGSDRGETCLYTAPVLLPHPGTREVEAKVGLISGLGFPPPDAPPLETALGTSEAASRSAEEQLRALGLQGGFAALNPGARKGDHRWPAERFAGLARSLHERHALGSLLLWGPGEEPLARRIVALANAGSPQPATPPLVAALAPPTDLDALAALLRRAALVVTNDTGPMHLAVACGAPVLALYLAADGERWGHPGPRFRGLHVGAAGDQGLAAALEAASELLALTWDPAQGSLPPLGGYE